MLEAERKAGDSQKWKARGKLSPRDSIPYQTVSRLPVANQVFLGFWMVDIHQEGCSQRSAPQKRHMAHLRRHAHCTPRKSLTGMGKAVRYTAHLEVTMLVKHLVT